MAYFEKERGGEAEVRKAREEPYLPIKNRSRALEHFGCFELNRG